KYVQQIQNELDTHENGRLSKYKNSNLAALLQHARKSCRYYQNLSGATSIEDFPVINKTIIRSDIDSFISSKYQKSELISVVTSGSTGTPFQVYHDANKRKRNSADTIAFANRAGFNVGDRLFYLKIWSASNQKSSLTAWLQIVVPFDVFRMANDEKMRLVALLGMKGRKSILGYASALEQVCKFLGQHPERIPNRTNLIAALSMSESLSDYTKEKFKEYFKVDLFARYSNLENGILAQQFKDSGSSYRINTASYVI